MAAALALAQVACISAHHKGQVCRSMARYPLGPGADEASVKVYHPARLSPATGDSICLIEHQDRSVVCVARNGLWQCSPAFQSRE